MVFPFDDEAGKDMAVSVDTRADSGMSSGFGGVAGDRPSRSGKIYYDEAKHKGHLVCPDCGEAHMVHIGKYPQKGDNLWVDSHFRISSGSKHSPNCVQDLRVEEPETDSSGKVSAPKDYTVGPVIFINGLDDGPAARGAFARAGRDWRQKPLVTRDERGRPVINNADLARREAFSAKTPSDLFRLMSMVSSDRLMDSRVVHGESITAWPEFMIHQLDVKANEDGYRRYRGLAEGLIKGRDHPVLLHFETEPNGFLHKTSLSQDYFSAMLPKFVMLNPNNSEEVMTVRPVIEIHDSSVFDEIRSGGSFFALCPRPYIKEHATGQYSLVLRIGRGQDIERAAAQDIARSVGQRAGGQHPPSPQ